MQNVDVCLAPRILLLALTIAASGCVSASVRQLDETNRQIARAVESLDRGIDVLSRESADWRAVIAEILQDLPDELNSTIRVELTDLLHRGIAMTGSEFRCDLDFLRVRIRQDLEEIREQLAQGGPRKPREPALCTAVPLVVDRSLAPALRNRIEYYGFDLDTLPITARLEDGAENTVDLTPSLALVTPYQATLTLDDETLATLTGARWVRLFWGGELRSSITVLAGSAEPSDQCQHRSSGLALDRLQFKPPKLAAPFGDSEFSGHGPRIELEACLTYDDRRVTATLSMVAQEWDEDRHLPQEDHTFAAGTSEPLIVHEVREPGWRISGLVTPKTRVFVDRREVIDRSTQTEVLPELPEGPGPLVAAWTVIGDTEGADAGVDTSVEATFLQVQVVEEHCPPGVASNRPPLPAPCPSRPALCVLP